MKQFKEKDGFAHSYLICRFDVCVLIDPSHSYEEVITALEGRTLIGILLTHAHNDHVDLLNMFDVPIYMHQEDAHLLFEDHYNGYHPKTHPYKRKDLIFHFVKDQDRIPFADQFIEVIHTPGHTKGSLCFLYDKKLFTGDTLFKMSVGRHDLYSGNLPELRRSILKLCLLQGDTKIYPGHDETSTIRYETKNNPFYLKWSKQIKNV